MSFTIGDVYERVFSLVNKHQTGRTYTPDQFNNDIKFILLTYIKTRYGLPEQPDNPQYFERTQKVSDDFSFLTVYLGDQDNPLLQVNTFGVAQKPSDYWHLVGFTYKDVTSKGCSNFSPKYRRGGVVTKEQYLSRLSSSIMFPTKKNPIVMAYETKFQFQPVDLGYVSMIYLRYPVTPFFDYDIINDEEVFLPKGQLHVNSSVLPAGTPSRTEDFELPVDCWDDIISGMLLKEYGIRDREDFLFQVADKRQNGGN